jgi:hypothetical protein
MIAFVNRHLVVAAVLVLAGCSDSPAATDDGGPDADTDTDTLCGHPDTDGDAIDDLDEGASVPVDTDGDTTPDFRDLDSDNDTVPDAEEAGPLGTCGRPADLDGDTTPDRADTDDDGDGIHDVVEIGPDPTNPIDFDGDGTPDYRDTDSDDDTIPDRIEGTYDTDGDTVPDFHDADSDDDGIPDATEGWLDTDEDGSSDFRDSDSDNDGVADWIEVELGTNPVTRDTDGDGATDLVEQAAGTDPLDPLDTPAGHGALVFVEEPYDMPAPSYRTVALGVPDSPPGTFAVSVQIVDDPSDAVDARMFVGLLGTNTSGERVFDATTGVERLCAPTDPPPDDSNGDGVADYFPAVPAGSSVCFDVVPAVNEYLDAVETDLIYGATLRVLVDGAAVLAERDVFFLIPWIVPWSGP